MSNKLLYQVHAQYSESTVTKDVYRIHTQYARIHCLDKVYMPGDILAASFGTQANIVRCHLRQGMHVRQCEPLLCMGTALLSGSGQCPSVLPTIRASAGKQS